MKAALTFASTVELVWDLVVMTASAKLSGYSPPPERG
jgi:hypothetical protein